MKFFNKEQFREPVLSLALESDDGIQAEEYHQEIMDSFAETSNDIQDTQRLIQTVVAIESLIEAKQKGLTGVALEGYRQAAEMAVIGTSLESHALINPTLSLEALASQRNNLLSQIAAGISRATKGIADNIQYAFSVMEFQSNRLRQIEASLKDVPNEKRTVKVRDGKYLRYDISKKQVSSGSEYLAEYKKLVTSLGGLSTGLVHIADDAAFDLIKNLATIFQSKRREAMLQQKLDVLLKTFDGTVKASGAKLEETTPRFRKYGTPVLLGLTQVEINLPHDNKIDINLLSSGQKLDIHIERMDKFEAPKATKGQIELEFSKQEIEALLDLNAGFITGLNNLRDMTSSMNSVANMEQMILGLAAGTTFVLEIFTKLGRLYSHTLAMLNNNVSSLYNVSFGNVKQALTIAEKYAGK